MMFSLITSSAELSKRKQRVSRPAPRSLKAAVHQKLTAKNLAAHSKHNDMRAWAGYICELKPCTALNCATA